MKHLLITITAMILIIGCSNKEPVYQGLTLDVWAKRLQSEEAVERGDALDVIKEIGKKAKSAERAVRQVARNDKYPDIRMKAIVTLQAMGSVTGEFKKFIANYTEPFLLDDEDGLDLDEMDRMFSDKLSGEDDLEYLRELEEKKTDSIAKSKIKLEFPAAESDQSEWASKKFTESISILSTELNNPSVLAQLMKSDDFLERQFAMQKLMKQMAGYEEEDEYFELPADVFSAFNLASDDNDSLIKALADEALNNWAP